MVSNKVINSFDILGLALFQCGQSCQDSCAFVADKAQCFRDCAEYRERFCQKYDEDSKKRLNMEIRWNELNCVLNKFLGFVGTISQSEYDHLTENYSDHLKWSSFLSDWNRVVVKAAGYYTEHYSSLDDWRIYDIDGAMGINWPFRKPALDEQYFWNGGYDIISTMLHEPQHDLLSGQQGLGHDGDWDEVLSAAITRVQALAKAKVLPLSEQKCCKSGKKPIVTEWDRILCACRGFL